MSPKSEKARLLVDSPEGKLFRRIEQNSPLICLDCGTCSIHAFLQCDGDDRQCSILACCANCGNRYYAADLPTYQEQYDVIRRREEEKRCRICNGRKILVNSMCDRVVRQCFFLVACSECGDVRSI